MITRFFCFICFILFSVSCSGDIGETYDLLAKREQLVKENERLLDGRSVDSLGSSETKLYIQNLSIIRLMDEDIFKSQRQTVDRISGTSGVDQYVNKTIALLSFLLAVALAATLYMLYIMNKKMNRLAKENVSFSSRVSELFSALLLNFQPAENAKKNLVVNRLIILGIVFMFFSFLGYLLKTLGV